MYWFERGGFLDLTGMPRPALGESCTTSMKDFAIFPPYQKKKAYSNLIILPRLIMFTNNEDDDDDNDYNDRWTDRIEKTIFLNLRDHETKNIVVHLVRCTIQF